MLSFQRRRVRRGRRGAVLQYREKSNCSSRENNNQLLPGLRQLARQAGTTHDEGQGNEQPKRGNRIHLVDSEIVMASI